MAVHPINSDALGGAAYDPGTRTLTVEFESGSVYEYYDVAPELFEELERSQPHPWHVVGTQVKEHRFRRIR
jgi:hypothetical protein